MLLLRKLTALDAEAFLRAYRATVATDPTFARGFAPDIPYPVYLARLEDAEQGLELSEDHVPSTMLWGVLGGEVVGRLTLRHRLNERLLETGGNIGYVVVPEYRRRGFATEMLRLALPLARERGLDRVLLTCDDDNLGSRRVIEICGGRLERTSIVRETGVPQRHYWIPL